MRSSRINEEGELRGQPANPGLPGKMAVKTVSVYNGVCVLNSFVQEYTIIHNISIQRMFRNIASNCEVPDLMTQLITKR